MGESLPGGEVEVAWPSKNLLVLGERTAVFAGPDNVPLFEEETLMEYKVTKF